MSFKTPSKSASKDPLRLSSGNLKTNKSTPKSTGKKLNLLATISSPAATKELQRLINSPAAPIQSPARAKSAKKDDEKIKARNEEKENIPVNPSPLRRRLSHMPSLSSLLPKRQKSERAFNTPTKTSPQKIFGVPLEKIMEKQGQSENSIPAVISKAIEFLNIFGVKEIGIFRISPSHVDLNILRENIENGKIIDFADEMDAHIVASLLKMFFRELPNSLLTSERYDDFVSCIDPPNLVKLKELVQTLPTHNLALATKLFQLFDAVAENDMFNQMTPQNIATTNAPNLLFRNSIKKEFDPVAATKELGQVNTLVTVMITHFKFIFTRGSYPS